MKAASEEVSGALQSAGQELSSGGSAIYLDQVQLNDLPVLGVPAMLPPSTLSLITMLNTNYVLYIMPSILHTPKTSDS